MANTSWMPSPLATSRQLILRLLLEKRNVIPIRTTTPSMPRRMDSRFIKPVLSYDWFIKKVR